MTKHLSIDNANILVESAKVLDRGGIIVYPTDTLYGFGADARNKEAINKINKVKCPLHIIIFMVSLIYEKNKSTL